MNIFSRLFTKKTNFKAGGLKLTQPESMAKLMGILQTPSKFIAPCKIDFRDMCIQTSNQLDRPACAGFSTAGHIEVYNWRTKHYPEQLDGNAIYDEAKRIDGDPSDGTTLNMAVKAALNLKLIKGTPQYISNDINQAKFAIHQHCTFVGGFNITDEWNYAGKDGIIPAISNAVSLGGHAVVAAGFDMEGIYIQNSWGTDYGLYGFCKLSWAQFSKQFMSGVVIDTTK